MRILIADDEHEIGDVLRDFLLDQEHIVDFALDGKQALDFIKRNPYDLAIFDFNMPEITGLELIKLIKKIRPEMKTVMMTGYDVMDESLAMSAGVDGYINKPFNLQQVSAMILRFSP